MFILTFLTILGCVGGLLVGIFLYASIRKHSYKEYMARNRSQQILFGGSGNELTSKHVDDLKHIIESEKSISAEVRKKIIELLNSEKIPTNEKA